MKRSLLLLLTSVSFFTFVTSAFGQAALTERWVCLNADKARSGKGNPAFRQYLSVNPEERPIPQSETYIIECLATDAGQICTTGNPQLDMTVYKRDNTAILKQKIGFSFVGLFKPDGVTIASNPAMTDASGDFGGLEWESNSGHTPRKFMAMNYYDPSKTQAGSVGGQQQGTFGFDQADKKCVLIQWDPYGRVFDSQTLEPIMGASVTLLFNKNGVYAPMTPSDLLSGNIINPQVTKEDGQFSFVVPDGEYKLSVVPLPVSQTAQVHPNFTKAYMNLYPAQSGEIITQRGTIQHRDVPVVTAATDRPPKLMHYFYEAFPNGKLLIQGTTSHPLTKIVANSVKVVVKNPSARTPYRQIGTVQADKWGRFSLEIDQTKLEKTKEYIELFQSITLIKTDLPLLSRVSEVFTTLAHFFFSSVRAAGLNETNIAFEPIPQYLEGYVYDGGNLPVPNATLEIVESFSNAPFSTVKADKTGFVKITSEYLPKSPYTVKVTTMAGLTYDMNPSDFVAKNAGYIADKNVDTYSYHDKNDQTFGDIQMKTEQRKAQTTQAAQEVSARTQTESTEMFSLMSSPVMVIMTILCGLFLIAGITIFIVVRQKKRPPAA